MTGKDGQCLNLRIRPRMLWRDCVNAVPRLPAAMFNQQWVNRSRQGLSNSSLVYLDPL